MDFPNNEKPLLVNASGDFSDVKIIQYKNRFLYSKYNPYRTILSLIQNATFLEGSIIVVCSPCLWYGLEELMAKLPESCKVIAIQDDSFLLDIARQHFPKRYRSSVSLYGTDNLSELDSFVRNLVRGGNYRRAVRIDLSAGVQLNSPLYNAVFSGIQEITASFWMNRITLVKMGRLFSKNIFQNLMTSGNGVQLSDVCRTVSKPIIVCGAGESLDATPEKVFEHSFVIAVDAALISLLRRNIRVDAVVSLESQYVIQKAYIGVQDFQDGIILFADITSRPSVVRSIANRTVWFASEYADTAFLTNLKKEGIIEEFIQPLGSVGLAATLIALKLRSSQELPVFVTGLDFSYSMGLTHALGTPAHESRLSCSARLSPIENYNAAFAPGVFELKDKCGKKMLTGKSMKGYADNFYSSFRNVPNLYDIGKSGIPLGIPYVSADSLSFMNNSGSADALEEKLSLPADKARKEKILHFYKDEEISLQTIKDLLINGDKSLFRNQQITLTEQLEELLKEREYLYLHFPDGYRLSTELSFLKRIRAETDFFLKQIKVFIS